MAKEVSVCVSRVFVFVRVCFCEYTLRQYHRHVDTDEALLPSELVAVCVALLSRPRQGLPIVKASGKQENLRAEVLHRCEHPEVLKTRSSTAPKAQGPSPFQSLNQDPLQPCWRGKGSTLPRRTKGSRTEISREVQQVGPVGPAVLHSYLHNLISSRSQIYLKLLLCQETDSGQPFRRALSNLQRSCGRVLHGYWCFGVGSGLSAHVWVCSIGHCNAEGMKKAQQGCGGSTILTRLIMLNKWQWQCLPVEQASVNIQPELS